MDPVYRVSLHVLPGEGNKGEWRTTVILPENAQDGPDPNFRGSWALGT